MSRREEVFRFRLTEAEQARLGREAEERGLSKADRIREALGWDRRSTSATPASAPRKAQPAATVDPGANQPGKAAIEALAKRISGGEGVPLRVARNRAKERLKSAAVAARA